jgi:hypothetical protein
MKNWKKNQQNQVITDHTTKIEFWDGRLGNHSCRKETNTDSRNTVNPIGINENKKNIGNWIVYDELKWME